jgi:hypothetical protein
MLPSPAAASKIAIGQILVWLSEAPALRRSSAFANRERNRKTSRWAVFAPLDVTVTRQRAAVKGVKRRLSSDVLWSSGSACSGAGFTTKIDILVDDRLAAVGSKGAIGYLGWGGFVEQGVPAACGPIKSIVFISSLTLDDTGRRGSAVVVFVDVDVGHPRLFRPSCAQTSRDPIARLREGDRRSGPGLPWKSDTWWEIRLVFYCRCVEWLVELSVAGWWLVCGERLGQWKQTAVRRKCLVGERGLVRTESNPLQAAG